MLTGAPSGEANYLLRVGAISVYLTEGESRRLAELSRSDGRSQADVVREAIIAYLPPGRADRDFALAEGLARIDDDPRPISEIPNHELLDGVGA